MDRMHHRTPLPEGLGTAFTTRQAAEHGVGRGRCSARDLARPFRGVRAGAAPRTFAELVACFVPLIRPPQLLGGISALRMWGLPVAERWQPSELLVVVVPTASTPPRRNGVIGRRLASGRATGWRVGDIGVVDPVAALFMCADLIDTDRAVTLIDAILTTADNYPNRVPGYRTNVDEIARRLEQWGGFPGCATIRSALPLARERVESPKETQTRLLLVRGGLPEPVVQHDVHERSRFIARVDLAYPQWKIAIEYEGDGHRTDKKRWRADIRRQRELEDLGWIVIRLTELDLQAGGKELVARIRRAIASR